MAVSEADRVFMPSPVTHITGAFWSFDMPWVSGAACRKTLPSATGSRSRR